MSDLLGAYPLKTGRFIGEDGTIINLADLLTGSYDPLNKMLKIETSQKRIRYTFLTGGLNTSLWDIVSLGSGMLVDTSANELKISTATTINSETIIQTKDSFTIPFKVQFDYLISQKVANQEFYLELVSVDNTDTVDSLFGASFRINFADSATNTNLIYEVWQNGQSRLTSGVTGTGLTQNAYSIHEIEASGDECFFSGRAIDSTNGKSFAFKRDQQIPDPNKKYKVRLRAKNLGTAPASSTDFKFNFINVQDYQELNTEVTGSCGNSTASQSNPCIVTNTPAVNESQIAGQAISTASNGMQQVALGSGASSNGTTNYKLISAASTNAILIKATAGRIASMNVSNMTAAWKFLKIYNKASAPTVGTDVPVQVFPIPPSSLTPININKDIYLSTGIAIAITGAIVDTDTTAVALNDLVVNMQYA